jgi:hypothetical protein
VELLPGGGVSANIERDDLDDSLLVGRYFEDLVVLDRHDRRPADLPKQDRLIEQHSIARQGFLFQQLLAPWPSLDLLFELGGIHVALHADDRPAIRGRLKLGRQVIVREATDSGGLLL